MKEGSPISHVTCCNTNANWQLQYQLLKPIFPNHASLGGPENARRLYILGSLNMPFLIVWILISHSFAPCVGKRVPLIRLKHGWCRCTSTTAFDEGALPWPCHFNISHLWYHSILYVFLTPYIVDCRNDFSANVQRLHVWLQTQMFHRALRPAKLWRCTLQIDWRTNSKSVRQRQ